MPKWFDHSPPIPGKPNDLRRSAAPFRGPADWIYKLTRDGVETGETHKVSEATVARDVAFVAKRRWAEEQRRKPQPDAPPLTEEIKDIIRGEFVTWVQGPLVLERAQHTIANRILPKDIPVDMHVLLVQHNWAEALGNAKIEGDDEGPIRVPYEITVFEFSFRGGVRVVVLTHQAEGDATFLTEGVHVHTKSGWTGVDVTGLTDLAAKQGKVPEAMAPVLKLLGMIFSNIRAICVMLEAEVAEMTPMREPYKRNFPKGDKKPLPALSHHIVSLSRRVRTTPPDEHEPGTPKRLHFRRGHWRHYPNHRTWIKWTLVGNPDLGFVDKEYKL